MPAGRPRKDEGAKRHPLNMRTTRAVRERLEQAAAESGRSLAKEVEARLERSFDQQNAIYTAFEGRDGYRMALALGSAFLHIAADDAAGRAPDQWMKDPEAFEAAMLRTVRALWAMHPEPSWERKRQWLGWLASRMQGEEMSGFIAPPAKPADGESDNG